MVLSLCQITFNSCLKLWTDKLQMIPTLFPYRRYDMTEMISKVFYVRASNSRNMASSQFQAKKV